ncbi:MAG: c-type cytochrome [Woeseiaceae bacterium]|nr:c-type cytochrome [Woeseiaceae bacterium]
MKRDQKFFDMYSLVIGVLAFISLGIFVLSMQMSDVTQDVYTQGTEEYREAVTARLKPFGEVYLPGEEIPQTEPRVAEAPRAQPAATTLTGPQVYNEACIACHGGGVGGAPMLTDAANWAPRLEQGTDVLYDHAINGYQGSAGYMPPKGGRLDLSDGEIQAAVDYMVDEVPN